MVSPTSYHKAATLFTCSDSSDKMYHPATIHALQQKQTAEQNWVAKAGSLVVSQKCNKNIKS